MEDRYEHVISSPGGDILTVFFTAAWKFFMGRGRKTELNIDAARISNDESRRNYFA
jgi:hypothetical protein